MIALVRGSVNRGRNPVVRAGGVCGPLPGEIALLRVAEVLPPRLRRGERGRPGGDCIARARSRAVRVTVRCTDVWRPLEWD